MLITDSNWTNHWNLLKELNWAESIIIGRLNLEMYAISAVEKYDGLLECGIRSDIEQGKHLIEVVGLLGAEKRQAIITYSEPETISEFPNLTIFFLDNSYFLISINRDWAELVGKGSIALQNADGIYQVIEERAKRAWLPMRLTNIPSIYTEIITCSDFEDRISILDAYWLKRISKSILSREKKRLLSSIAETREIASALAPTPILDKQSVAGILTENDLHFYDRLLLALALMPHIYPEKLDHIFMKQDTRLTKQVGSVKGDSSGVFLPTAQTFLFIVSGLDTEERVKGYSWLCHQSLLIQNDVIKIQTTTSGDVYLSGVLSISEYYLQLLMTGSASAAKPKE
jgi:hypothetical protein